MGFLRRSAAGCVKAVCIKSKLGMYSRNEFNDASKVFISARHIPKVTLKSDNLKKKKLMVVKGRLGAVGEEGDWLNIFPTSGVY